MDYFHLQPSPGPSGTRNNSPATSPSEGPSALSTPMVSPVASPAIRSPRSSFLHSRSRSEGEQSRPRPNHRVKFTVGPEDSDTDTVSPPAQDAEGASNLPRRPTQAHHSPVPSQSTTIDEQPLISPSEPLSNPFSPPLSRAGTPPPGSAGSPLLDVNENEEEQDDGNGSTGEKKRAIHSAYERAQQLASLLHHPSQYVKRKRSGTQTEQVPMEDLEKQLNSDTIDYEDGEPLRRHRSTRTHEAHELVRNLTTRGFDAPLSRVRAPAHELPSGQVTPHEERDPDIYADRPAQFRGGVLSTLLKLYGSQGAERERPSTAQSERPLSFPPPTHSPGDSGGRNTPRTKPKWYSKSANQSTTSLTSLAGKNHSATTLVGENTPLPLKKSRSSGGLVQAAKKTKGKQGKPRLEDEIRITVHIAETLSRQRYLVKLCRALMKYGAPTHRLEEYMRMTARVLEIDGQFLYIPGCMIVSFDDASTHTAEVQLIRSSQGVDLGRFADVHEIYKEVVHDVIGVEEAMQRLDELMRQKPRFNAWWLMLLYGCASAAVGPFAFGARPIDMPIAFFLGGILGLQQHVLAPRSDLYANVFEVTAAVVTSFLSRAFGSIPYGPPGGRLFCYSALSQSSIALILPGFTVLCGSLELQSRNIVAGSIRLVYAIIYSLFLGFGIMIGTAVYGLIDHNATSEYTCPDSPITNEYLNHFPFVIIFTLFLILINQGKWKQAPVMLLISFTGYVVTFFSSRRFSYNTQIANALGAFAIGLMGNLYSRLQHGLAAAAILPGIFVQVPSGLASSGSLISGLTFADEMVRNNSTAAQNIGFGNGTNSDLSEKIGANRAYGNMVFDIGYGMLQVSIAITVGLFLAALVIYPVGKRRSGLFSF